MPSLSSTTQYWLMKAEPADVSIDDLAAMPLQRVPWYGVRNYQARNFMRDQMRVGDLLWYYHSACAEPGIAGLARVCKTAYADATQFDPNSKYFDPAAKPDAPRWLNVEVELLERWQLIPLQWLRNQTELADMRLLAKGNRLSILPIEKKHWDFVAARKVLRDSLR